MDKDNLENKRNRNKRLEKELIRYFDILFTERPNKYMYETLSTQKEKNICINLVTQEDDEIKYLNKKYYTLLKKTYKKYEPPKQKTKDANNALNVFYIILSILGEIAGIVLYIPVVILSFLFYKGKK